MILLPLIVLLDVVPGGSSLPPALLYHFFLSLSFLVGEGSINNSVVDTEFLLPLSPFFFFNPAQPWNEKLFAGLQLPAWIS